MKTDAPLPAQVPKKRRQLETALDLHIAQWLASDTITPSERRRLEDERAARKAKTLVVGHFDDSSHGMTKAQKAVVRDVLAGATQAVHAGGHSGTVSNFHGLCLNLSVPIRQPVPEAEVVDVADLILVTPRESAPPPQKLDRSDGVWGPVRYARRRGANVKVILPDGSEQGDVV